MHGHGVRELLIGERDEVALQTYPNDTALSTILNISQTSSGYKR